eukprot:586839-Pelagomonas_calceolata.AAC.2
MDVQVLIVTDIWQHVCLIKKSMLAANALQRTYSNACMAKKSVHAAKSLYRLHLLNPIPTPVPPSAGPTYPSCGCSARMSARSACMGLPS